jgi:dihydrodipicolinate synthase/N-acetylneuraminate lyase
MPYFVFDIRAFAQFEKVAEFSSFKDASAHAKALRAARRESPDARIKVMFGETQQAAEDLLMQVREPGPTGDD